MDLSDFRACISYKLLYSDNFFTIHFRIISFNEKTYKILEQPRCVSTHKYLGLTLGRWNSKMFFKIEYASYSLLSTLINAHVYFYQNQAFQHQAVLANLLAKVSPLFSVKWYFESLLKCLTQSLTFITIWW